MRLSLAIALLTLVACKRDRVSGTGGELRLGPQPVEFPHAYVGQVKHTQLGVTNTGLSDRTVLLKTAPPFTAPLELKMPGATTTAVELDFTPLSVGDFLGELTFEDDQGETLTAALHGVADPPAECLSSSPCRTSTFDGPQGLCIEVPVEDGRNCTASSACFVQAQCVGGECVGSVRDCDDHDACSTDVCEPQAGCVHFPATARCAASTNPCQVPACDPVIGCTFTDAEDGTPCGPADCTNASICLVGQCRNVAVRTGAPCGDVSPCQARGQCSMNVCVRPAATGLVPEWTFLAGPSEHIDWDAIADLSGNLYWRVRAADDVGSKLVSVRHDGTLRYAVPLDGPVQVALMDGVLVVRTTSTVEGRRPDTGALLWSRDFTNGNETARVNAISRGIGGSLYVGYARADGGSPASASTLISLNVFNGAPLWEKRFTGEVVEEQSMPVDEQGYVYVGTYKTVDFKQRYHAFSPGGSPRWGYDNPHAGPAAVFGGHVYHWDHWISETTDGGFVNAETPKLNVSGYPRLALGAISYVGSAMVDAGSCNDPNLVVPQLTQWLVRVDPATSDEKWSVIIGGPDAGGLQFTNPVLTSRGAVLFSQNAAYCAVDGKYLLREVSAFGEPSFECVLPGPESYFGEGLLTQGLWVAAIRNLDGGLEGVRAIALDGVELPTHGWATAWGSSNRDNHAP